jgi:SAM-dependent methyltransferase
MNALYQCDLAYIQAVGFGSLAQSASIQIVRFLRSASIPIRRVVDVGCGAGVLTKALIDAGFDVTGIDISSELLEIARKVNPETQFLNASAYEADLPRCEAIIAIGEPLTYHENSDADDLVNQFFGRASSSLPLGGILIFDVIELGEPSLAGRSWYSGEDWAALVETTENQSDRTLVRNIETFRQMGEHYRRGQEVHKVRLFETQTLCKNLSSFGFTVQTTTSYGNLRLPPRRRAIVATRQK